LKHVVQAGAAAGHGPKLKDWSPEAIALAAEQVKAFEANQRQRQTKVGVKPAPAVA
jgi:hypothetical protein